MYNKELRIAKVAAREAGQMLKREFFKPKHSVSYKAKDERVTKADKKAEAIILKKLNQHFPNYARLSEESGRNDKISDYSWIIDPMDGTTNFTVGHSMFAVSIALSYKNNIVMGVVYNVLTDQLYYARLGGGAWLNSRRLKMSTQKKLRYSVITYCHGAGPANTQKAYKLYQHFHNLSHHCRHFGATTLELALLAAGQTEAHLISGAKLWDVAAGVILVREAGGIVSDWQSRDWNIKSKTILASTSNLHPTCQRELKKIKLA